MRISKSIKTCIRHVWPKVLFVAQSLQLVAKGLIGAFIDALDALFPLRQKVRKGARVKSLAQNIFSRIKPAAFMTNSLADSIVGSMADFTSNIHYLLPYQDALIKRTVWNMKYHRDKDALNICADIFYDEIVSSLSDRVGTTPFSKENIPYIIYSPSSSFALGQKSYDHMQTVCEAMEKYFEAEPVMRHEGVVSAPTAFAHICHGAVLYNSPHKKGLAHNTAKTQHTGSRKERLSWAKNRFKLSENFLNYLKNVDSNTDKDVKHVNQVHIICIDDVTTTGATFNAIQQILKEELAAVVPALKVESLALCH